eukprot:TRINITY_DN6222_c0_g1_i4.p1 TRINITY_DN6222_c0_g1~~TRINITY_DN6222_c0_g1_i4.p1  ORF type:complete len:774 (+),score=36.90 TRINITY_DN6222_c0_g1_i4:657-2978(+)
MSCHPRNELRSARLGLNRAAAAVIVAEVPEGAAVDAGGADFEATPSRKPATPVTKAQRKVPRSDGGQRVLTPGQSPSADLTPATCTVRPSTTIISAPRPRINLQSPNLLLERAIKANAALPRNVPPFLRVRDRIEEWRSLTTNETLLTAIRNGVTVPLTKVPGPMKGHVKGPVESELLRLRDLGVLRQLSREEVRRTRTWTPTFAVPKKDSEKVRMVTDLRALNQCTSTPAFKQASWKDVLLLLGRARGQYMAKLDLEEYFFHLAVSEETGRWIRIRPCWEMRGLPFGLESSPYWSARLARPVIHHLQSAGVTLVWYVDDILVVAPTEVKLISDLALIISTLNRLGFAVNMKKSVLQPTQKVEYLGLVIESDRNRVTLTTAKMAELRKETNRLINRQCCSAKALAKIAGQLQYYTKGHGALMGWPRFLMREAGIKAARSGWTKTSPLTSSALKVLTAVTQSLTEQCPVPIPHPQEEFAGVLYTDASSEGWGAKFVPQSTSTRRCTSPSEASSEQMPSTPRSTMTFQGRWTLNQSSRHITEKETLAISYALRALSRNHPIKKSRLLVRTDSIAARAAVSKGSAFYALNWSGALVRSAARELDTEIVVEHVPGVSNPADEPSRAARDEEDYKLKPKWLRRAVQQFQVPYPTVDLFASRHNASARSYYAVRDDGGAGLIGVNAMAHPWTTIQIPYANPPFSMMESVLSKAVRDKVPRMIVVAPVWRSATWWPLLNKLTVDTMNIPMNKAAYQTERAKALPPPRWRTTVRLIVGQTT